VRVEAMRRSRLLRMVAVVALRVRTVVAVIVIVNVTVTVLVLVVVTMFARVAVWMRQAVLVRVRLMRVRTRMGGGAVVGAAFGLERGARLGNVEPEPAQQFAEHVVRLEDEAIVTDFERDMAIAEVVRGAREVERRRARGGARGRDEHGLCERVDDDERAVLGDEDVAAANDRAARQEHADGATGRVDDLEAALLPRVPVERDGRGAAQQRRREAAAAGDQLARDEHRHRARVPQNRK